jgi:hypothetical protein
MDWTPVIGAGDLMLRAAEAAAHRLQLEPDGFAGDPNTLLLGQTIGQALQGPQ